MKGQTGELLVYLACQEDRSFRLDILPDRIIVTLSVVWEGSSDASRPRRSYCIIWKEVASHSRHHRENERKVPR